MKKLMLSLLATFLGAAVLAADTEISTVDGLSIVPSIKIQAPPNNARDVRIHFYIDAHKSMLPGDTFKRAAAGLRMMLGDINNPIKKGLRDRGVGERVEINTGTAYLIMAKEITPFSLSGNSVFPKVKAGDGKWDLDSMAKMILDGQEKESQNVVICVISNDPNLKHAHGAFSEVKERGLVFFMLWAPKESVDGPFYAPYWSEKEWSTFLRGEVGPTANDVANVIVDRYYYLSDKDIKGLATVACAPQERKIDVNRIFSVPQKDMWTSSFTVNGKAVPAERDEAFVDPEIGQNKIVVSVESPTGITYTRTWEGKDFTYFSLEADRNLLNDAKKALADAAKNKVAQGRAADELLAAVSAPDAPMTKEAIDAFKTKVKAFQEAVNVGIGLNSLAKKIESAEGLLKQIKEFDKNNTYLVSRQEVAKSLEPVKSLDEKSGSAAIDAASTEMDGVVSRLSEIKDALVKAAEEEERRKQFLKGIETGYAQLYADISKRKDEVEASEKKDNRTCQNKADLEGFSNGAKKAKDANDKDSLQEISKRLADWTPNWLANALPTPPPPPPPEVSKEDVLKRIAEINKQINARTADDLAECTNKDEISVFENKVKSFDDNDKDGIKRLWEEASKLEPKFVDVATMRDALKKQIQGLLDNKAHSAEKITNRATLDGYLNKADSVKKVKDAKELKKKVDNWKPNVKSISILPWILIAILVACVVTIIKKILNRPVAVMTYKKAGCTDDGQKFEILPNKPVSFDRCFSDCTIGVRVNCEKDGNVVKYKLTSPAQTVWLQSIGGARKIEIGEIESEFEDGEYQIFDQQFAMDSIGTVRFTTSD